MIRRSIACIAGLAFGSVTAMAQVPLTISDVQTDVRQFNPSLGEQVKVRFSLNRPATIELRWFDARDLLVRRIVSSAEAAAGEGSLSWNGRDEAGKLVPNEAYHFTLMATAWDGATQEHDLTDLTGGDDATIQNIVLDGHSIKYALGAWSRVNIRIGMRDGGPLLGSVVNWQVRAPGENTEAWNGMDASGVMQVAQSTALELIGMSFPLPQNTVIAGDPKSSHGLITSMPWGETRRVRKQTPAQRMYAHSQQSYEERGDFIVKLVAQGKAARADWPLAIRGLASFSVDVEKRDVRRLAEQRFELVYFIDGQFVGENEIGFLPATWNVDADRLTPGEHYLTVNVRGYDGTFGMGSRKILVH